MNIKQRGFTSPRRQGGWIGAAIGLAGSLFAGSQAKKAQKEQNKLAKEGIAASDPYAPYRKDAAERLKKLMDDPNSIQDTGDYKARMQAAERTMAAQGYTGSGNALVEAANAGGDAYNAAFQKLSMLSGAGATPGAGYGNALNAGQAGADSYLSGVSGIVNNAANLGQTIWNRPSSPAPVFNAPAPSSGTNTRIGTGPP